MLLVVQDHLGYEKTPDLPCGVPFCSFTKALSRRCYLSSSISFLSGILRYDPASRGYRIAKTHRTPNTLNRSQANTLEFSLIMTKEKTEQEKINEEWNSMAGEWDDLASDYAKSFYDLLRAKSTVDMESKPTVVDFGCGTGLLTELLYKDCSRVVAVDASSSMIRVLKEKIRDKELPNVQAACVTLSQVETDDSIEAATRELILDDLKGSVDLIVASSVMNFIPKSDLDATLHILGSMLKPGGIFCHSDWPESEGHHPDAMTLEKAEQMYQVAGLVTVSTEIVRDSNGTPNSDVFFGVARKP